MEGLVFYILLLVSYIAYKLMFLAFPAVKKWSGYPSKPLKGKFCQTDFLIMPSDLESSYNLCHEVTQRGMESKMEIVGIAHFDSLHNRNDYRQSKIVLFRREFFQKQNFGPYGVVAVKADRGVYVDVDLECSPESFSLIMDNLHEKQPVLIRVFAFEANTKEQFIADHFAILPHRSDNSAKYFVERYLQHVSKDGGIDQEKLAALKEKFKHVLDNNSRSYH